MAALVALSLLGAVAIPGLARRVANPSPPGTKFTGTVTDGVFRIKSRTFDLSEVNPRITLTGTVAANGDWFVPISGMNLPPLYVDGTPIGRVTVRIQPTHDATGSINPLTGVSSLRFRFRLKLEGGSGFTSLGGNCYIGSTGNPIDLNPLTTGTTNPPGPNRPISGQRYDADTGGMEIVNNSFSVPQANDCGAATGSLNSELGLPSAAGNNEARFIMSFNPRILRAITASYTATAGNGGFAPSTVDFDASASSAVAGIKDYRWDFDGNGTFDRTTTTPTTSFTYTTPGARETRLRVTDIDGDFYEATRTVTIAGRPDAAITKSHTGDFRVGAGGAYRLVVSNAGEGPTTGVTTVTDTLPTGLTYTGATGSGWSCGAVAQQVTCTRSASIAAGSSAPDLVVQVGVARTAAPAVTNTASVTTPNDLNATNDSDSDPTTVTEIDLAIEKSHSRSFRLDGDPGGKGVYTLAVTNRGSAATAGPATVSDTLPNGLTYVAASGEGWSCSSSGQTVTCIHADPIAAGAAAAPISLEVDVSTAARPSVTNTASVSTSDDTNGANNADSDPTVIVEAQDLDIDKSHTGSFRVGTNGVYTLAVRNDGPQATTGAATVSDTLPAGLSYVSASGAGWSCGATDQDVTCTHADPIDADTSAADITLEIAVAEAAGPSVTNTASVSTAGDVDPANNTDEDPTEVKATDLAIEKTSAAPFRVDRNGTYTLAVRNAGSAATSGPATITDTLPAGLTYVSASGDGWSCGASGATVTCTYAAVIPAGGESSVTLTVAVGEAATPEVTNTASVATADDIHAENDSDSDTAAVFDVDLTIAKSHAGIFEVGKTGTYTLAVRNAGSRPTSGESTVTDVLPAGLSYVSASGGGWSCAADGQQVTCTRSATLAAETSAPIITLRVAVAKAAFPATTNSASVEAAGDRNGANDSASDPTPVTANDLTVAVSHTGSFRVGTIGRYALAVTNAGTAPTTGASTITDTLPSGLSYVDAAGPGWACSAVGQVVTCTRSASIANGATAPSVALDVDVQPGAVPAVTNTASVAAANDPNSANDSAADLTDVTEVDLSLTKTHSGAFRVGENGSYILTVDNLGTAATLGTTTVVDNLPAGLTYAGAGGAGWTCSAAGQDVRCDRSAELAPGETAPEIALDVEVDARALPGVTNTARVTTRDDGDATNDTDDDDTGVGADPADSELTIRPSAGGADTLRAGANGTYVLAVRNIGALDSAGPMRVRTSLPPELAFAGGGGSGWSCSAAGRDVTCSRAEGLVAGARSDLRLEVDVAADAPAATTLTATVATPGDANETNDTDTDTRPVRRIDLALTKTHAGSLREGSNATYTLAVRNAGSSGTEGATSVTDQLPAGLTFVRASGSGWACGATGQAVRCEREERIPAGATAPEIALEVAVGSAAVPAVTNTAVTETAGDSDRSNDTGSDLASVGRKAASVPLTIAGGTVRLTRKGQVGVRISCTTTRGESCAGTLALKTAKPVRARRGPARAVALGSRSFTLGSGRSGVVTIRLSKTSRALVTRYKRLPTRATGTLSQPRNAAAAASTLVLLPAKGGRAGK